MTKLPHAIDHAKRGWRVLPLHNPLPTGGCTCQSGRDCDSAGKHPRLQGWQDGATTDLRQIKLWWHRWPDANIGIATGEASGIIVLDVDGEAGRMSIFAMETGHATLPETWTVRTPGGGQHMIYRYPRSVAVGNKVRFAPGLDTRSDGGLIAAVGSSHASGGVYDWEDELSPEDVELSDMPEWLLLEITACDAPARGTSAPPPERPKNGWDEPKSPYNDPRHWLDHYVGSTTIGNRNDSGFALAGQLLDNCYQFGVIDEGACLEVMAQYAQDVPQSGKPYTIRAAVASFYSSLNYRRRYGFREPCGPGESFAVIVGGNRESDIDRTLAVYPQTDLGNAERFIARHGANLRWCPAFGRWYTWDGIRWCEDESSEVIKVASQTVRAMLEEALQLPDEPESRGDKSPREVLRGWARRSESEARMRSMISVAQPWCTVLSDVLDADPWLLNCLNGTLDLRTGVILPHCKDNLITKLVPFNYTPEAPCPMWMSFLEWMFQSNDHLIGYLQRASGYALTGVIREQVLFFLHGSGANGKSTFLSLLTNVMGDYAKDTPTDTLMVKMSEGISNDVARLKGARMVTAVETERDKRMAESLVKRLTGGDTITARFMRQEYFQFRATFKIFLAANNKPSVRGTDDGIWRRLKMIPFEAKIASADQDPQLTEKLKVESEGILAWMVRGCLEWQSSGLGEPSEVSDATDSYRSEMDYLGPFLDACCVSGEMKIVGASELYKSYVDYCEQVREKSMSQTRFGRLILDRPGIKRVKNGKGNQNYHGIGLNGHLRTVTDSYCTITHEENEKSTSTYSTETVRNPPNPPYSLPYADDSDEDDDEVII